ncbi:MAG: molybdenum ABC transporter ATP-binding protein [Pseudomonadota bacterium]
MAVDCLLGDLKLKVNTYFSGAGVTALLGPSGAGKTSLLRVLAGLEYPQRGRVALGEEVWSDSEQGIFVAPHRRRLGFVFQDSALFSHLSVRGNLAFAEHRIAGRRRFEADEVIALLELEDLLPRAVDRLSGGEQRRVALARALLSEPRWLLLDEPLAGLDGHRRRQLVQLLETVHQRFAVPTILVTHQLDEVARLVDHVVVLQAGAVASAGPAATLLPGLEPALHSGGAVLEGRWQAADPRLLTGRVRVGDAELLVPMAGPAAGRPGTRDATGYPAAGGLVRLFVRPEDVAVARSAPADLSIRNLLPCRLDRLTILPDSPYAELELSLGDQRLRSRITRLACEALDLREGDALVALIKAVSFDPPAGR